MSSKRQQTMAKMTRERTVRERREKKQEKRRLKRLAAAEGGDALVEADIAAEPVTGELDAPPAPAPVD